MPVDSSIDHTHRRVTQLVRDPVATAEVLAAISQQVDAGAWTYASLVDCSQSTWIPSTAEMRAIVARVEQFSARHGRRGPLAMVSAGNAARFGMFRMYSALTDAYASVSVFDSVAEAEAWLAQAGDARA